MFIIKIRLALLGMLMLPMFIFSQVTTSSITGFVKDTTDKGIEGASITATHTPSGSIYTTISKKGGSFTLPGLKIGGPYNLKISYVGYNSELIENITLLLGQAFAVDANLTIASAQQLKEVVVNAQKRRANSTKEGASTVISQRVIANLPVITRSLTDYTKLTPQSNGTSFAGRDGRYNNTVVDGANLNNNFGLNSEPMPGGGASPISIDAIEEISVNISPYDVKQSNFTGAGISAITKSGTNTLRGSLYGYYRDQNFNGRKVGDVEFAKAAPGSNQIYGATLGGAIVKNKLFYFAAYEWEKRDYSSILFSPKGGSGSGTVSNTSIDSLKKFSDYLQSKYNYNTGAYDNFPNFVTKNYKFLVKIDWNISQIHKLVVKFSDMKNTNDQPLNSTSIPTNPSFSVVGGSGTISRLPNNRFGVNSMSFANSNYGFLYKVTTATMELNSNFKGKFANQLLLTYTKVKDVRTIPGGTAFPTIDIFNNNGQNYMSAGTDPFTRNNTVINDIYSITDNFTYYLSKHTLTAGIFYEYQKVGNMFMPGASSYYAFNSLNDFMNNKAPAAYAYTYSLVPGEKAVYSANLRIGQLGVYLQDEWKPTANLQFSLGLRVDLPIYPEQPLSNPNIAAFTFPDKNGNLTNYTTGNWPKATPYFSPRLGFRYTIPEQNLVFRGGTGMFTGRMPFVYLTNIPSNSYMYQSSVSVTASANLANYLFNPNPDAYAANFSTTPGVLPTGANIVMTNPDFKFPKIWRSNLAIEKGIGKGWTLTLEALFAKDINAIFMRNANMPEPNGTLAGVDNRPRYTTTASRKLYSNLGTAIILDNVKKGLSGSFTAQIAKNSSTGLYGSFAYTYSYAAEATANPGSVASSVWQSNATTSNPNTIQMDNSAYVTPHRFVGNFGYKFNYSKFASTTVSLFFEASRQGNFSFVYNGDINFDGINGSDLMYITRNVNFIAQSASTAGPARTIAEQAVAWNQFIDNTPYLNKRLETYAGRNGAYLPWYMRFDVKVMQDFFVVVGKKKQNFQVSLDMVNAANLLNKQWGTRQTLLLFNPLVFKGYNAITGVPEFNLQQLSGQLATQAWGDNYSTLSTWGLQLGLKYFF